ncbi:MAG: hypothetical protein FWG21_07250, partial [Oscillospiraceae bacterium]|nr:hypothetical protein [Oscillospiraceae bacterium]
DFITDYEYEAIIWMRDNTLEDSVFVSDRILLHNKYMYYTAFSERRCFLEGYVYITSYDEDSLYYDEIHKRIEIVDNLYSGSCDITYLKDTMTEYGVDYLIVSSWQHPNLSYELEMVYENRDITLYRIDG